MSNPNIIEERSNYRHLKTLSGTQLYSHFQRQVIIADISEDLDSSWLDRLGVVPTDEIAHHVLNLMFSLKVLGYRKTFSYVKTKQNKTSKTKYTQPTSPLHSWTWHQDKTESCELDRTCVVFLLLLLLFKFNVDKMVWFFLNEKKRTFSSQSPNKTCGAWKEKVQVTWFHHLKSFHV